MTIEIDTHAHTLVSGHAYNTMREMVQMAAEKGLKGLALTEHAPKMPGSTTLYYFENLGVGHLISKKPLVSRCVLFFRIYQQSHGIDGVINDACLRIVI